MRWKHCCELFGYDYIYCWMPWSYWNGLVKSLSATGHKFPVQTQLKDAQNDKNNCVDWEFEYCRYSVSFEVNYNVKKNSQTLHKRKMSSRCPYKRLIAWTPRQKEAQPPPSRRRVLIRAVGGAVLTALTQMSRWLICVSGEPLERHATCKELFKGRFSHRTESCSLSAAAVEVTASGRINTTENRSACGRLVWSQQLVRDATCCFHENMTR